MKQKWSRRKFIEIGSKSIVFGVATLIFSKWLPFAKAKIPDVKKKTIVVPIPNKVLVAYESQFGSTAEVAEVIGQVLSEGGSHVCIKKMKDVTDLDGYSRVVIGSAIQYDKWMPEARKFVMTHQKALAQIDVSCFLVCLVLSKGTAKSIKKSKGYALKISELVPSVPADSIGQFAGVLDYSKMSFGQRLAAKAMFAIIGVKEGDYRDWKAIRDWAGGLF